MRERLYFFSVAVCEHTDNEPSELLGTPEETGYCLEIKTHVGVPVEKAHYLLTRALIKNLLIR